MPFDGSGNFQRTFPPGGWVGDAQSLIKIKSDRHDTHDKDLADGLTNCITKDGQSQPINDIPMNGHKIVNLAEPINDTDAATLKTVKSITSWTTSKTIEGADLNGRLIFSGTGVTGIQWTVPDLSWVAKIGDASKTSHRLVLNDKADATGNDVFVIDDGGNINNGNTVYGGQLTNNLSWDGTTWRAIALGYGTRVKYLNGVFTLASNDVATTVDTYKAVTLRDFYKVTNTDGTVILDLIKSASGKAAIIRSYMTDKLRWAQYLGTSTPETGVDRVGSDYILQSYNNAGGVAVNDLVISRSTHAATFAGDVSGQDLVALSGVVRTTTPILILAAPAGGNIRLRPDGPTSALTSCMITGTGDVNVCEGDGTPSGGVYAGLGIRGKAGTTGGYSTYWMNSVWNGSTLKMYANTAPLGDVAWACDYRIKKDIRPLPSTWEKVKALNPISYTQKAYEVWTEESDERWGFLAHELQERLSPAAASGVKDGPEVQSPNLLAIIAGLTRALQEAMLRIEALEAGT